MDQNYEHVTVQIGWRLRESALIDEGRNQEQGFDDFTAAVISALQRQTVVVARTIYGVAGTMREVKLSASIPLPREQWAQAIRSAVASCCVLTDESRWSFS